MVRAPAEVLQVEDAPAVRVSTPAEMAEMVPLVVVERAMLAAVAANVAALPLAPVQLCAPVEKVLSPVAEPQLKADVPAAAEKSLLAAIVVAPLRLTAPVPVVKVLAPEMARLPVTVSAKLHVTAWGSVID